MTHRERTAELDGVEFQFNARGPVGPGTAGGAAEMQTVRAAMAPGPFRHDVGHQHAVVVRGEVHRPVDRPAQIHPVHPWVAVNTVSSRYPSAHHSGRPSTSIPGIGIDRRRIDPGLAAGRGQPWVRPGAACRSIPRG